MNMLSRQSVNVWKKLIHSEYLNFPCHYSRGAQHLYIRRNARLFSSSSVLEQQKAVSKNLRDDKFGNKGNLKPVFN